MAIPSPSIFLTVFGVITWSIAKRMLLPSRSGILTG
jgi:hypothetical protein